MVTWRKDLVRPCCSASRYLRSFWVRLIRICALCDLCCYGGPTLPWVVGRRSGWATTLAAGFNRMLTPSVLLSTGARPRDTQLRTLRPDDASRADEQGEAAGCDQIDRVVWRPCRERGLKWRW